MFDDPRIFKRSWLGPWGLVSPQLGDNNCAKTLLQIRNCLIPDENSIMFVCSKRTVKVQRSLLVLKISWRSASRISESAIYGSDGHHPTLAKFHLGEDAHFPEEQRYITGHNLRGSSPDDDIQGMSHFFKYRLLLESRARSLWIIVQK